MKSSPQIIDRIETEALWTRPLCSWPEATRFGRQQLLRQGREIGATLLVFDRTEMEEHEEHTLVRMYALAWSGDTDSLAEEIDAAVPGSAARLP